MSAGTGTGLLQGPRDVLQGAVRLVESFQSDLVSAVVEWLAVSHSSCNDVAEGDVAALGSKMFGRRVCKSVVQKGQHQKKDRADVV